MSRYWGFWTVSKLDLLHQYLNAFTTALKRQPELVYLDLFGGQPDNRERYTENQFDGSARIALTIEEPPFTRLRFFELEPYATRLATSLRSDFADRDLSVVSGDCNETIHEELSKLRHISWAPTFAFIDPNGPDINWNTLKSLAQFKQSKYKVEIFLLFAIGMFTRTLIKDGSVSDSDSRKLTNMYGNDQWKRIYDARVDGQLEPGEAREEYVNLMRWQLEQDLGYRWTHPLAIHNEGNTLIYYMIFATDNEAGTKIMTHIYRQAAAKIPAMRRAARCGLRGGCPCLVG